MTNGIPLGRSLLLPVGTVNCVQTLKDIKENFDSPSLEELCKPTVVVATLCKASGLFNEGVPRGHFNMIVIDEAGQARCAF